MGGQTEGGWRRQKRKMHRILPHFLIWRFPLRRPAAGAAVSRRRAAGRAALRCYLRRAAGTALARARAVVQRRVGRRRKSAVRELRLLQASAQRRLFAHARAVASGRRLFDLRRQQRIAGERFDLRRLVQVLEHLPEKGDGLSGPDITSRRLRE